MSLPKMPSPETLAGYSSQQVHASLMALGIDRLIQGLSPARTRFCGRAFTVAFMPCGTPDARVPPGQMDDYADDVPAGYVAVLDNRGRGDVSVLDAATVEKLRARGALGAIVDGACDPAAASASLPVLARGSQTQPGVKRVRVEAMNLPVVVSGLRIECDDIILGDAQGVVVIPRDYLKIVLNHRAAHKPKG